MKNRITFLLVALLFCNFIPLFGQNVGVNTENPEFTLDVRGTDDNTSSGELQLSTPNQTNFLRFFGGRQLDPNPFLAFHDSDSFHIVTTLPDFSTYKRRMTFYPNGYVGIGTDQPNAILHLRSNSSIPIPNLRLTETVDNFARIKFETNLGEDSFWDIAASTTPDFSHFNLFYRNDSVQYNVLSLNGEIGQVRKRSAVNTLYELYYTDVTTYRGFTGFGNKDYLIGVSDTLGKVYFYMNEVYTNVIDEKGNFGIKTLTPQAELDVSTFDVDDGAAVHLSNQDKSHFLRLFGGKESLPYPIIYWHHGDKLEFGLSSPDESDYVSFVSMNGKTIGVHNTGGSIFIGEGSGTGDDLSVKGNIGIGSGALYNNIDKVGQVAVGDSALFNNGIGAGAGFADHNTAIGAKALYSNKTGGRNTAIGFQSMYSNTDRHWNTAVGYKSLHKNNAASNSAVGHEAMMSNTTGFRNTAIGSRALCLNEQGNDNQAFGYRALSNNLNGQRNIGIGANAMLANNSGNGNIAIGVAALLSQMNREGLVAIGDSALVRNGIDQTSSTHASSNMAIGSKALMNNTIGHNNLGIGRNVMRANVNGALNTVVGNFALENNDNANFNVALGGSAMRQSTSGGNNVAVGYQALFYNNGIQNTVVGNGAMLYDTAGWRNSVFGKDAMLYNKNGSNNTIIGYNAGRGVLDSSYSGNVLIGYEAGKDIESSKRLYIDNSSTEAPLIYGEFNNNLLRINGDQEVLGELDIQQAGVALRVSGREAIWSDGTKFSWGFGDVNYTHNQFERPISVGPGSGTVPGYTLLVKGTAGKPGGGSWSNSSDIRLKTDVINYTEGLKEIMKIRPVKFHYNEKSGYNQDPEYVGVIAQELKDVAPYMVSENDAGYLDVDNSAMMYMLINAVKEQQEMIENMRKEILDLKNNITKN